MFLRCYRIHHDLRYFDVILITLKNLRKHYVIDIVVPSEHKNCTILRMKKRGRWVYIFRKKILTMGTCLSLNDPIEMDKSFKPSASYPTHNNLDTPSDAIPHTSLVCALLLLPPLCKTSLSSPTGCSSSSSCSSWNGYTGCWRFFLYM